MPIIKTAGPDFSRALRLLRAISTPLRLRLLVLLKDHGALGVPQILDLLKPQTTSVSNLSEQLQILIDEGLVKTRKAGRSVFYGLNGVEVRKAVTLLGGLADLAGQLPTER
jgi:DNA-binding transcriptional ArsR family regulator